MIDSLLTLTGRYVGQGINHAGEPFLGSFAIISTPSPQGFAFHFEARSFEGTLFHLESSLLATSLQGKLCLWVLSNNHPAVFKRELRSSKQGRYIFGFGNPEDRSCFREEILLEIQADGLRYAYSWGMPSGDFAERSSCTMKRQA